MAGDGIPILKTDRLELLPLGPERDLAGLHRMYGDPEIFRYDPASRPTQTPDETRKRLEEELAGSQGWTWSIRVRGGAEALGTFGLFSGVSGPVRGLTWRLRRDSWGQGFMSEAARVAVPALLERSDIEGVEAWIDVENVRSRSVARHAGLDERGRLPLVYPDRISQSVVMVRSSSEQKADTLAVWPILRVNDVRASADLLCGILGMQILFVYGEPPAFGRIGLDRWSGSPGIELHSAEHVPDPSSLSVDIGISVDLVFDRATSAGLKIINQPSDFPWMRREFEFKLPERHRVRVLGPLNPGNPETRKQRH